MTPKPRTKKGTGSFLKKIIRQNKDSVQFSLIVENFTDKIQKKC